MRLMTFSLLFCLLAACSQRPAPVVYSGSNPDATRSTTATAPVGVPVTTSDGQQLRTITAWQGDSIASLAAKANVAAADLAAYNGLTVETRLTPGQILVIPPSTERQTPTASLPFPSQPGDQITVRAGDTLFALARRYGVSVEALAAANGLSVQAPLRVGQVLTLPQAAPVGGSVPIVETPQTPDQGSYPPRAVYSTPQPQQESVISLPPPPSHADPLPAPEPRPRDLASPNLAQYRSDTVKFARPHSGKIIRTYSTEPRNRFDGIEIAGRPGDPVTAAGDGKVTFVGDGNSKIGPYVLISHPGNWVTLYSGLKNIDVLMGDQVRAGQTLGTLANRAEGARLHFELRRGVNPVDPLKYM